MIHLLCEQKLLFLTHSQHSVPPVIQQEKLLALVFEAENGLRRDNSIKTMESEKMYASMFQRSIET